jgi:ribonuclease P protein component
MPDVRLRRDERLKSRKQLKALFEEGRSLTTFPLRCIWLRSETSEQFPVRVAFSVSRRIWRNAVDRNLLKRRMREAYRLNKHLLYEAIQPGEGQLLLACLYTSNESCAFDQVQEAMSKALVRIAKRLSQTPES